MNALYQQKVICMKTTLVPYLSFDGETAEAIKFYQSILGGKLTMQTYGEAFPETPDEQKEKIIHASLTSDAIEIMASDCSPEHGPPIAKGNNVSLSLIGTDKEKLTEYFDKLAEGGVIEMKLDKQFWGDTFGAVKDKFGIHWMVNISEAEK